MKLILIRHGESEWNKKNLFTGWTDVDLTENGVLEAKHAGLLLKEDCYDFDICYTSYLKRAIHTLNDVLDQLDRDWLPIIKSWKLNERHYGALQGLNKTETALKYGEEQVKTWRRSFDVRPPVLDDKDERNPKLQEQYRNENNKEMPLCESLKDTIDRVVPYFDQVIKKDMKNGKKVLIVAHGNSIRALAYHFEKLSEKEIMEVNVPTGVPLVYEFDDEFHFIKTEYLGDPELIKSKIQSVANQGKVSETK
ncbi:MAG: 2,3-diphosphoglycerate-dependent phosphoglycerate mutase [Peptostreptococcaceae bacterium]|nr:2,3-diphosphoglycerate-dependent phosphoglycerate mutase [Peptostreptococcaceae bacterium]